MYFIKSYTENTLHHWFHWASTLEHWPCWESFSVRGHFSDFKKRILDICSNISSIFFIHILRKCHGLGCCCCFWWTLSLSSINCSIKPSLGPMDRWLLHKKKYMWHFCMYDIILFWMIDSCTPFKMCSFIKTMLVLS